MGTLISLFNLHVSETKKCDHSLSLHSTDLTLRACGDTDNSYIEKAMEKESVIPCTL